MKIEINKNDYDGTNCVFDASQSVSACGYMNGRSCSAAKSEGQSLDVGQTGRKCIGKRKFSEIGEESVSLPVNKKKRAAEKEEKKILTSMENENSSESLCAKTISKIQEASPLAGNIANSAAIIMEALWHGRIKPNASDIGKYVGNFGPLSSKLGQLFAANVNIPWEKRKDFLHLCKNNQPESFDYIDQQIKQAGKELGFDIVSIEKKPIGVGTIAQVHKAKIKVSGEIRECAIKVVRRNIIEKLERDYSWLKFMLKGVYPSVKAEIDGFIESVIGFCDNAPDFESSFMKKYLNDFHEDLKRETDMKLELERMNKYGEMVNWVSTGSGRTPDWGMASKNVMVMELVKGDVVSDLIERGEGAKDLSENNFPISPHLGYSSVIPLWQ